MSRAHACTVLFLALGACNGNPSAENDLEHLDRELTAANDAAPGRDPALAASLHDQIMVDPALAQGSNANAIRPPNRPETGATPPIDIARSADGATPDGTRTAPAASGNCPECRARQGALTLGALAARQRHARTAACAANVRYSAAWANRLPADLPLYPDARIAEAAGADRKGCALRVVSFVSRAGVDRVINWYFSQVTGAGYTAEHKASGAEHVLAGTRGDAAYTLYLQPRRAGGTEVDLVTNAGI